jgi:predicted transcriptional regulator with HTH domain
VEQVIKGLKNNSSPGFDEILTSLVKQCLCHFIKPLDYIYNVSLQTGFFSDVMKKAKIKPLFKKGASAELGAKYGGATWMADFRISVI